MVEIDDDKVFEDALEDEPVEQVPMELDEDQHRQVQQMIERDQLDPRQQMYMKDVETGKLIRTQADYHRATKADHQVIYITYNQAFDLYRKEQSETRQALQKVMKRKAAKKARKANRGR